MFRVPISSLKQGVPSSRTFVVFRRNVSLLFTLASVGLATSVMFVLSDIRLISRVAKVAISMSRRRPSNSMRSKMGVPKTPSPRCHRGGLSSNRFSRQSNQRGPSISRYSLGVHRGVNASHYRHR